MSTAPLAAGMILVGVLSMGTAAAAADKAPSLQDIVMRLSRTALLFRDTALEFTCRESISWTGRGKPGKENFEYVFVYDEENGFQDYRTERFFGKRRSAPAPVDPERYGVPVFLRSAYLWIFVFRESRQPYHRYRIVGEEEVLGVPAVQIEFEPIPPYREKINDWFGTAWVDPEMGQLLKVVAYRPGHYHAMKKLETYGTGGSLGASEIEFQAVTTLFTEEKNGLRFPGKVIVERTLFRWAERSRRPRKKIVLRVEQSYRKYQFFSVRTSAEIRAHIRGETDLGD